MNAIITIMPHNIVTSWLKLLWYCDEGCG